MASLNDFPAAVRWPAERPQDVQLYTFPTPNGMKVVLAAEEMGLNYEPHIIPLNDEVLKSPEFLSVSPNNKIPAMIDPNGPGGEPISIFESGAILIYLAEKTGQFLPTDARGRSEVIQWLMWQMGGVGPFFGQLGFFVKFAGTTVEDPLPRERYIAETRRLLGVLDKRLEGRDFVAGDYSIADMAIAPWIFTLDYYEAMDLVGFDDFERVDDYLDRITERPAYRTAFKKLTDMMNADV